MSKTITNIKLTDLATSDDVKEISDSLQALKKELNSLRDENVRTLVVDKNDVEIKALKDAVFHEKFEDLLAPVVAKIPVLVTGEAGGGKTFSAVQIAQSLGLEFRSLSVGQQTSKTDLLGYLDATGQYITTSFREMYENGGVFIMDEIDAGNSNVLIAINSALSNGFASFPDGQVTQHKDFRFIATANTIGKGTGTRYVGRNQLDGALLDRFVVIEMGYSLMVESKIFSTTTRIAVSTLRKIIDERGYDAFISTRLGIFLEKLLTNGMGLKKALEIVLHGRIPEKDMSRTIIDVQKAVKEG